VPQVSLLRPGIPQTNSHWKHPPASLSLGEPVTFSIFSCFLYIQPTVFQPPDKAVILSEALRRSVANRGLYGAESKDPGDACWQMLLRAFRPQTTPEDKKVTNSERSRGICGFFGAETRVEDATPPENPRQAWYSVCLLSSARRAAIAGHHNASRPDGRPGVSQY
jgi:hypothetical protein